MNRLTRLLSLLFVCSLAPALFAQANLTLSYASFSQLAPGSGFNATAYYGNSGPSAATGVKLTITVPPGFQYQKYDAYPSLLSCAEPPKGGQGDLVCTASSLAVVDYAYVNVTMRVDPAAVPGTVITTSATLTASNAVQPSTSSASTTVIPEANLRIAMSAPASVTAGDSFLITFTVTNDGPATANFAELDVAQQALVRWSAISGPPGWSCGSGFCRIGSFPPGTATFTITATVDASTTLTSVKEQAQVWSYSDGDFSDNVASGTTTIIPLPHADVKLSVVADKTSVIVGHQVTNTYTVTNNGPDGASYVDLQIGVPGALSSVTSTFASCTQELPVYCIAPGLAAGGTLTATVTFTADQLGTFTSIAHLQWPINSGTTGYTTEYTPQLQVLPDPAQPADVSAAVTMPPTAVYSGGTATASGQVTVTNAGPATAQLVTVDFDAHSIAHLPGFTCGIAVAGYRCTAGSMAPGSVTGTVTATWIEPPNGTIETTTVTAASASTDPDATNNSASAKTTVVWQSNLTLQQLTIPSPALAGVPVVMDLHYSNAGPSSALDAKFTITVPAGAKYDSYSSSSNDVHCTEPPKGGQGDLVCSASELHIAGDQVIEVVVHADPADAPGTVITFPATLTCANALKPSQNVAGSLTVAAPANLRVALSSPPTVVPGNTYQNTVTVTNAGPGNALTVQVVLTLTGTSYVASASGPAGWQCVPGSGVATCFTSFFPTGSTATFTFAAGVSVNVKSGTLTQTATVTSVVDPDTTDNVATSTTTIGQPALTPVSLQFTASPDSVANGGTLTYTARIANTGSVDAKNVELYLSLPGLVQTTTCGTVDHPHCTFPTIAAGATQTVTATTQIYITSGTSVYGDAIVIGANFLNDIPTTTVTTPVTNASPSASADLSDSVDAPPSATVGDLVTFTVNVTNAGNLDASNVSVRQTLPAGLAFVSASAGCSGSPVVTCTMPMLTSGARTTFTITATATAAGTATLTSTAATTSAEQNTGNNSTTATVMINAPAPPARRRAARH